MKKICDITELKKALDAANLSQFVKVLTSEQVKQTDGVTLPVCDIMFAEDVSQANIDAVNAVFDAQAARDWRAILIAEPARLQAIDDAIRTDNIIAQIKAMTPAEYDAWWAANVTNAAQAIGVLKRVVRILCRRVL